MVSERALREVQSVSLDNRRRRLREQADDSRQASGDLLYRAISAARNTLAISPEEAHLALTIVDSLLEQDVVMSEERLRKLSEER